MTMHHQLRHDKRRPMKLPEGIASQMQTEITKVPPKNPASTVYNLYNLYISCIKGMIGYACIHLYIAVNNTIVYCSLPFSSSTKHTSQYLMLC